MRFLANSKHILKVWRASTRASIIREMEFRGNFLLGIIRQSAWLLTYVFLIDVIFNNTQTLSGWSQVEVLIVLAMSRTIEGLINVFFTDNAMRFPQTVQQGTFDFYLTKPVPAQFFTFFQRASVNNIGNVLIGLVLFGYALLLQPDFLTPSHVLAAIVLAGIGMTIYYSLLVIVASLVFRLDRLEALWGFNELFSEPLTVPFDIFPSRPRIALTYILPLAFVVFIPAQAIVGRLNPALIGIGIGLTIAFLALANIAWKTGIKRYSSASS